MELIDIKNEEEWVLRILNSCKNLPQINCVDKLFKNFLNKWSHELSDVKIMALTAKYERNKSFKTDEIEKKISI